MPRMEKKITCFFFEASLDFGFQFQFWIWIWIWILDGFGFLFLIFSCSHLFLFCSHLFCSQLFHFVPIYPVRSEQTKKIGTWE
jgi:hypothetical protein